MLWKYAVENIKCAVFHTCNVFSCISCGEFYPRMYLEGLGIRHMPCHYFIRHSLSPAVLHLPSVLKFKEKKKKKCDWLSLSEPTVGDHGKPMDWLPLSQIHIPYPINCTKGRGLWVGLFVQNGVWVNWSVRSCEWFDKPWKESSY